MDWAAGGGVTNRSTVDYLPLRLNWGQSSWSNTNPDLVYAWGGSALTSYNVRTAAVATVKDFTSVFPGEYVWQLTHSINDDVWAFTRRLSADYSTVGYAVWKASTDTVLYTTKEPIDEVEIDKSGRYLIVKLGDMGGDPSAVEGRIVDLQTGSVRNLTNGAPDFNLGHSGMGTAFQVGGENLAGIDRKRIMAAPWTLTNLIEMPWLGLSHYSMLADDENWVTTYSTDPVPKVFGGEIGQLKTDGSYGVRRFAHHWATISGYGDYPFANISRNGAWVAFGSNWQKTLKGGRKDVYVVATVTVP